MWVVARDKASAQWLAATIFHGTSPRGEQFRYCSCRSANGEVIQENSIEIGSEEWPVHEGRKIWGAGGAFASIRYDMRTLGAASAPSANELPWFYMGFRQSARPGAKRVSFTQRWVNLWKRTQINIFFCDLMFSTFYNVKNILWKFYLDIFTIDWVRPCHRLKSMVEIKFGCLLLSPN